MRIFEKLHNFRDIGGTQTQDGRTLKAGVLFRSGELSRLTVSDQNKLQKMGIRLVCDLRSVKESQKQATNLPNRQSMRLIHIPLHREEGNNRRKYLGFLFRKNGDLQFQAFIREYYHQIIFSPSSRVGEAITLLSQPENLPALVHCTAGKDRTGLLVGLLQLLVGVSYEKVKEEYLRTDEYYAPLLDKMIRKIRWYTLFQVTPERVRLIMRTYPELLDEMYHQMIDKYGSVEAYLEQVCGVSPDVFVRLRALFVE